MPLSPEQEALCERLEKGESTPTAATLIRQQAREIDDLWDRLSRAYALVRQESPAEMIQDEMEALRAMLDERRSSQLKKSWCRSRLVSAPGLKKDRPDYTVYCGGWAVGRIYATRGGPDNLRWFWSMTTTAPMALSDRVATLEEAKAQFRKRWDVWKVWAKLEEIN
jgi:hypothetical protein